MMEMMIDNYSNDGNREEVKSHYKVREIKVGQEPQNRPGTQPGREAVSETRVKQESSHETRVLRSIRAQSAI